MKIIGSGRVSTPALNVIQVMKQIETGIVFKKWIIEMWILVHLGKYSLVYP